MSQFDTTQEGSLLDLAERVREHFDSVEQDVPDQSFLVGGAVRDALLGIDAQDFDFVVVGETPETMEARGFQPIEASSFPVFHDSEHEEWALARTEEKQGHGYKGFEVFTDGVSLEDDLERRDLTMNAMAFDVNRSWNPDRESPLKWHSINGDDALLVDPHGGVGDIEQGVLRHVSEAFAEDPLRVLRVARYAARFAVPTDEAPFERVEQEDGTVVEDPHRFASTEGNVMHAAFHVADETEDMMRRVAPELNRMSRDRIGMEIRKAMEQSRRPSRFFEVLKDTGALAVLWPELDRGDIIPAGPEEHHAEGSVFDHSMMVLDRMDRLCVEHGITGHDRVRRLLMAVSHDLGKTVVADKKGGIHSDDPPTGFPGHSDVGAAIMEDTARRLGLGSELKNVMADGASEHMRFHDVPNMPVNELLDFITDTFPSGVENDGMRELPTNDEGEPHSFFGATAWELLDLAHADHEGRLKITMRDPVKGTDLVRTMTERPTFERDLFVRSIEAVFHAENNVDGYEALESGLCDEHAESEIDRIHGILEDEEQSVQAVMSQCPQCRTPDDWVGQRLEKMKLDEMEEVLAE